MRRRMLLSALALIALAAACAPNPYFPAHDYDGDHRADRAWFHQGTGVWHSGPPDTATVLFAGQPDDVPAPADYDGDGRTDIVVVRQARFWVRGDGTTLFDMPAPPTSPVASLPALAVPADYDGDGRAEPAWYRGDDATWFIAGHEPLPFGRGPSAAPGTLGGDRCSPAGTESDWDHPVPADYDGDRRADVAVFDLRTGAWRLRSSRDGSVRTVAALRPVDGTFHFPAPGDYDGVGRAQPAVLDQLGWHIEGRTQVVTDPPAEPGNWSLPASADYDGRHDRRLEPARLEVDGDGPETWSVLGSPERLVLPTLGLSVVHLPLATGYNAVVSVARFTLGMRAAAGVLPCGA